jgi:hypothetical protein
MGTKAEELVPGATGCLAKAASDEPLFILRAKDALAPGIVRVWVHYARSSGTPESKLREALELAERMERWQAEHGKKVPD